MNKKLELLELFEDCFDFGSTQHSWEIFEADDDNTGLVDGVNILARAVGPFFAVNGKSQNKRFYEKRLWERVLHDKKDTIDCGQMLGTIGHHQPLDDKALLEGKVSHRISKLWINEGKKLGMGELLVLNTAAGRTLNAYLRGGVKFPVSSRGYGKYNGQMEDGTQIVDADTYKLETFDFVRIPGIKNAIPQIVESKEDEIDYAKLSNEPLLILDSEESKRPTPDTQDVDKKKKVNRIMAENNDVLQKITEEKISLEQDLKRALESNTQISDTNETLKARIHDLEKVVEEYRGLGSIEDVSKVMDVTEGLLQNRPMEEADFVALQEQLAVYEEYGTPDELEEIFDKFESFMEGYETLGSPNEIDEALDRSMELVEAYAELGTPDEVTEAFDGIQTFLEEMRDVGTLEEVNACLAILEDYAPFGSPGQLSKAFEMMEAVIENTRTQHLASESQVLAKEYDVDQTVAESMVESMGSVRAREVLGAINENRNVQRRYKVGEDNLNEALVDEEGEKAGEESRVAKSGRASRLFETLSR